MAERTFRSPNFFDREQDLAAPLQGPVGTPAGVIGTAQRGPAFVPVTVGSFADFETRFGSLDPKNPGSYAAQRWLDNQSALSFMRVLGAGANDTTDDIETTRLTGQVKNAGFVVTGTAADQGSGHKGAVHFLAAKHTVTTNEALGMPLFTDNDSYTATSATDEAYILRAAIFTTSGTRLNVFNGTEVVPSSFVDVDDVATVEGSTGNFKLVLSSSDTGLTIYTASLNPTSGNYVAKILNTAPEKFAEKNHLLYLDFSVDDEIATVSTDAGSVGVLTGTANTSDSSGDTAMLFRDAFGHYDTRFQPARTTSFISQPFGKTEYDLFHFESLDDGVYANKNVKVSIANLRGSTDPKNPYGTFEVQVRKWDDTDQTAEVIERFPGCNLDPRSDDYVGKKVGDRKIRYAFDADSDEERRIIDEGKYNNNSTNVRIVMTDAVERRLVPAKALPFGFRGIPTLKTTDSLTDTDTGNTRIAGSGSLNLSGSIVPPMPFRFKVTRGNIATTGFAGNPGVSEEVDGRLYWGAKLERNKVPLNSNTTKEKSGLGEAYSKLQGLQKLDVLVSGTSTDSFNENKFTLARVAFSNAAVSELTGSDVEHMKEAAYIRNGNPDSADYSVTDGVLSKRITLATLVNLTSSADFNRFQTYNKFTNVMYGGFDGVNILDKNAARLNDKGSSSDTGGGAASGYVAPGLAYNPAGEGKNNNAVFSYQTAAKIFTNPFTLSSNGANVPSINLLSIPGIKDSFITDFVANETRNFGLGMYVMDIPSYDKDSNRLFTADSDSTAQPNVSKTSTLFDGRAIDNNYAAVYFPDVVVEDEINNRRVEVPASVAAMAAISFNDRVGFPWFAPAGFNRASLNFVTNTATRLTVPNRDTLYDARINPIANLANNQGFVIMGQKNLQQNRSALDRVNVRRLMIEIKRIVSDIARRLVFEANNAATRARFVNSVAPRLGLIQAQSGIELFNIIMDERNNSDKDVEQNRLNGRIVVVPTRAVEFIAVDFIVTNAGVSFETA